CARRTRTRASSPSPPRTHGPCRAYWASSRAPTSHVTASAPSLTVPCRPTATTSSSGQATVVPSSSVLMCSCRPIGRATWARPARGGADRGAQAEDAAEAVRVSWQPMPFVIDTAEAADGKAPAVWDELPTNACVDASFGSDDEAVDVAFAEADHVVTQEFHVGRVTGVPIEPRAALGAYESAGARFVLYAGSGGAFRQRRELAVVCGLAPDQLRVVSLDVGGNFGTKNRVYVEYGLVLWAARALGRPARYTAT